MWKNSTKPKTVQWNLQTSLNIWVLELFLKLEASKKFQNSTNIETRWAWKKAEREKKFYKQFPEKKFTTIYQTNKLFHDFTFNKTY